MDDRLDQVLQRLDAIEQRLAALESRSHAAPSAGVTPPGPPPPPPPSTGGLGSEERRIVDLIVSLTAEHVEDRIRAIMREEERRHDGRGRRSRERHDPPDRRD